MKGVNNILWPIFPSVKDLQDTLTKEVERLCILGVLKQQQMSNWALPSFIVPNKIKQWDFHAILQSNKCLVRKPFPIPKNEHGIAWVNKSYATALDLNLGYYTIKIG